MKDRTNTRHLGGKGNCGLLVVKDLIKINMGTLRIKSKPGRGPTVIVTLPEKPGN